MKVQFNYNLFLKKIYYIMKKSTYSKKILPFVIFIGAFIIFLTSHQAYSLKNPSAVYCSALGYDYKVVSTPEGDTGKCIFPDNTSANAWDFLRGAESLDRSYCSREGYGVKHVVDLEFCNISDECTACVLPNGTEEEVTKLMGLSFLEGVCGDGHCAVGENYANCPQDCPSGSIDGYCDGVKDGKCDPDCSSHGTPEKDPDCLATTTTTIPVNPPFPSIYIYIIIIAAVIAVAAFFLLKVRVVR